MKRMLINATQEEELRVALVDGQYLYDLDIESPGHEQKKANIYKGKITAILPSLEAAFVDYGTSKPGFLSLKEVSREYFPENYTFNGRPNIKDVLHIGQELIVQIDKEERGEKGAALTTFISLAGSYLVLMPNNPRAEGISRRIEGEDRDALREIMSELKQPEGMGVIIRTAGLGKSIDALQWDLEFRLKHWEAIKSIAASRPAPFLIHQESNVIVRAFRDYLQPDIGEILIDNEDLLKRAKQHVSDLGRPDFSSKIKLYSGEVPLFSHFQIESQIKSAFEREVTLPSGGSIVIDTTEALTAIDINSARSTRGGDIEETAFNTNLEAADEIARQLRLRDLGGLIVIDFIDMTPIRHQREVEARLRNAVRQDRARIQVGKISRFGLLEMSRQRLSPSLGESSHHVCPRCSGTGIVRDDESLSLSILRLIEEYALKDNTSQVYARVPVTIAAYLLNSKRDAIKAIETRQNIQIIVDPDSELQTPHNEVNRIRVGEEAYIPSYLRQQVKDLFGPNATPEEQAAVERPAPERPALSSLTLAQETKPISELVINNKERESTKSSGPGFFSKLFASIKGLFSTEEEEPVKPRAKNNRRDDRKPNNRRNNRNNRDNRNNRQTRDRRNNPNQDVAKEQIVKEEQQTQRRERNNNNRRRNNEEKPQQTDAAVAELNTTNVAANSEAPQKEEKRYPVKERRQRRNLAKKVRITDQETVEQSTQPVIAEDAIVTEVAKTESAVTEVPVATQAVAQNVTPVAEEQNGNTEDFPRRSRRSPRHLRVSGQRRRRYREEQRYPEQSPMPLTYAVASPEFASGKVCINYGLLKENQPVVQEIESAAVAPMNMGVSPEAETVSVNTIPENTVFEFSSTEELSVFNAANESTPRAADIVSSSKNLVADAENSLNIIHDMSVSANDVAPSVDVVSSSETLNPSTEEVIVETCVAEENTTAENDVAEEFEVTEEIKVEESADAQIIETQAQPVQISRYATSPVTKAPAPAVTAEAVKIESDWIRPEFDFKGKGSAGGHSATNMASSSVAKPQLPE